MGGLNAEQLTEWNTLLGAVISAPGEVSELAALCQCLGRLVKCVSTQLICYPRIGPPEILLDTTPPDQPSPLMDIYRQGAYLLDPFYRARHRANKTGVLTLTDIAPTEFSFSDYYLRYYRDGMVHDEVCLIQPAGEGWMLISPARRRVGRHC